MADETQAEPRPPICPKCNQPRVTPLNVSALFEGVQYWKCGGCGHIWGTRYGKAVDPGVP